MALVNWKTWASGDVLTAADMNQYTRDNGRWLSHNATSGAPSCRVYRSTNQTGVASGTAILYDSERFDVQGMHSTVTNTSRLTVPSGGGGNYLIGAVSRLLANASAINSELGLNIVQNGATNLDYTSVVGESTASRTWRLTAVTYSALVATDYVECQVLWTNMTTVDVVTASAYSPEFWCIWIGEG